MRGVLGILAGLMAAVAMMVLVMFVGSILGATVPAMNPSSPESIRGAYAALGTETLLLLLTCWFLGSLAGAFVAKKIAGMSLAAWTVAGLMFAYLLLTVLMLPMPGWMQVAALAAPLIAGYLANRLIPDRIDARADGAADGTAPDAEV